MYLSLNLLNLMVQPRKYIAQQMWLNMATMALVICVVTGETSMPQFISPWENIRLEPVLCLYKAFELGVCFLHCDYGMGISA